MIWYTVGEVLCIVAAVVGTCGVVVFGAVLARRGVAAERRRRARVVVNRARRRAELQAVARSQVQS